MNRLLLIDAYAMIYRAYYAFIRAPRINSKGENTSAVFGFLTTLEDLKKRLQPTHLGVAFDPHGPTFRHEVYPAYKAQREETPEDIRKAVPVIKEILSALRIPVLEVPGFEADDVIGTLSGQAEQAGFEVFMATPDKDYGQLVTERVHMYRPRFTGGFDDMGPQDVCEKYGIESTAQVIDLLGLMGDASDNIPGCTGVGEKTAVKLLQQFGSIENMLDHTDEIKGALRGKIEAQAEQIRFSKFLVTIKTDVPVSLNENELLVREPDMTKLVPLYMALEFRSLLKQQTAQQQPQPAAQPDLFSQPAQPDLFTPAPELDLFSQAPDLSALSEQDKQEISIAHYLLQPEASHDPEVLCTVYHCQPSELKERVLGELRKDERLYRLYTDVELPLAPILKEMHDVGVRFDADILRQASVEMHKELDALEAEIYALVPGEFQTAGFVLNINSPKQVGELLFGMMQLDPKAKKTKGGQYVTSEEVLQGLKHKHPIVGKILEYRELKKLLSTYIDVLPSLINPATGKIHTTYNQLVTATGRLSSSNPNLQNLPIRSERGKFIRQAVIADEGCLFLSADYSQIELRLMAHFSGDEHMLEAFRSGQDIHAATAAKIFGCPLEEVTKEQRRRAKTANFGIIYGISAFGLAQQLDCSRSEAQTLINDYFKAFPGVAAYIEQSKERARKQGYVETAFGRRRYLPDITSQNATVRGFAERNAVNAPIQGTAADLIKIAMVRIHSRMKAAGLRSQMTMQVHDELNFNVPEQEVETMREIVVSEMQGAMQLQIPLIAECGVGHNWLEAH